MTSVQNSGTTRRSPTAAVPEPPLGTCMRTGRARAAGGNARERCLPANIGKTRTHEARRASREVDGKTPESATWPTFPERPERVEPTGKSPLLPEGATIYCNARERYVAGISGKTRASRAYQKLAVTARRRHDPGRSTSLWRPVESRRYPRVPCLNCLFQISNHRCGQSRGKRQTSERSDTGVNNHEPAGWHGEDTGCERIGISPKGLIKGPRPNACIP